MHTMHDVASDFVWRIRMPRDSKREYVRGALGFSVLATFLDRDFCFSVFVFIAFCGFVVF